MIKKYYVPQQLDNIKFLYKEKNKDLKFKESIEVFNSQTKEFKNYDGLNTINIKKYIKK